jgi:hypothetical protein
MSGQSKSAHHTRRTLLIAALAASVAALAAPTTSKAGVFQASTSFEGWTEGGWAFLSLGLPKYSGPGRITDVTLTMVGITGGRDYFPYDPESGIQVPGSTRSWLVPLDGPPYTQADLMGYPSVYVPGIDIPPTDQGCPTGPFSPCYAYTDFVASPFGDNEPVANLSYYQGVGSNTFLVGDQAFSLTYLSMTLTETITTAPEPSTWSMMFLGFGLIGLLAGRTARKAADS